MKVFVYFGIMIVMLGIWVEVGTAQTITETDMPDPGLRNAVLQELKGFGVIGSGDTTFTRENMADTRFTRLHATGSGRYTSDLTGVKYATSLTGLTVSNSDLSSTDSVSDISELMHLTSLTTLNLNGNSISDISVLSGLTSLTALYLVRNMISDISVLSGLTSLEVLSLNENMISNISVLSGLTSLERLYLDKNMISTISVLSGLTSLTELSLNENMISTISALSGLTSLERLYLDKNRISNTDALVGLTTLKRLWLYSNRITAIAEFQKLQPLTNNLLVDLYLNPGDAFDDNRLAVRNNIVATLQGFLWTRPGDIPADEAVRSRGYSGDPPTTVFRFPITFAERVTGFHRDDITVETELETGTGAAALEALSPTLSAGQYAQSYTATIGLPANAIGTVIITLHARAAETDGGAITPAEDIVYDPIAFTTIPPPPPAPVTEPPKRKIIFQCPVGWQRTDGFARPNRRVLLYEVNLEMDLENPRSIYKPVSVAIYVHPDEGLESLDGWKLQVAIPYNHHREYLLTAENAVVVDATLEGVSGGFAYIENPEENPFPMVGMGFTGATVPGFDYRLYDETGRKVDFGISCYKRGDIFQVLKDMEDPRVLRKVLLETLDWDVLYIRSEWTVPVPVNVPGAPSLQGVNLVGKWAALKKQ
ncbi:MAG: leucine-rich repeat domain-containing protein [Candidatus Poribacteria bacterium]|nr:leucine-rich repeat domain-containing protein [Candidatus Poribacteria bacterium]